MLTSEEVSKIERDFADGDTGWMGDRASLRALLKDRAELQAENERLKEVVKELGEHPWHAIPEWQEPLREIDAPKWYELVLRARELSR